MTYNEIIDWTMQDLKRGWKSIETIHDEFVELMQGGGLTASKADEVFDDLTRPMFFYDRDANTLVNVKGSSMTSRRWLRDHPTFRWVSAYEAGEITYREGFMWTLPVDYYGTNDEYQGASISTALRPDGREDLYTQPF